MKFQFLSDKKIEEILKINISILKPLYKPIKAPKAGDWLSNHEESGQTFQEYLQSKPVLPRGKQRILYIQPLGSFSESQRKIITLTAKFMEAFFNLRTEIEDKISLSNIPAYAQRTHPKWGDQQILTSYVMRRILKPRIPSDAAAYIAFTTIDLWPGKGWNFVFGQASLVNRIGVFSIYRNGNPDLTKNEFQICLLRTIKTGAHEISHIFSLEHCILYECLMNGANSQAESDRKPLTCCPECMAKISWATRTNPIDRFEKLEEFCQHNGFNNKAIIYQTFMLALKASHPN
jgi:archaemetzincin